MAIPKTNSSNSSIITKHKLNYLDSHKFRKHIKKQSSLIRPNHHENKHGRHNETFNSPKETSLKMTCRRARNFVCRRASAPRCPRPRDGGCALAPRGPLAPISPFHFYFLSCPPHYSAPSYFFWPNVRNWGLICRQGRIIKVNEQDSGVCGSNFFYVLIELN